MSAGTHDGYGKRLLRELLSSRWDDFSSGRSIDEAGVRADLDGVIRSEDIRIIECAVEIEARVYKQIRGAIVDLVLHPAPKKLLVIILAQPQLGSKEKTEKHLRYIWSRIAGEMNGQFEMVCLEGHGNNPRNDRDKAIIAATLQKMNIL